MVSKASSVVWVLLCILLAFTALANAAGPAGGPGGSPGRNGPGNNGRPGNGRPGSGRPKTGQGRPKTMPEEPPTGVRELLLPEDGITAEDDASVFSFGDFNDHDAQALFENFNKQTEPFFSKVYDYFAREDGYIVNEDAYEDAKGDEYPFHQGRPTGEVLKFTRTVEKPTEHPITATFDPHQSKHICRAWSTLASYCDGAGGECACYSGTYYVPDQWNSLAVGCAVMTTRCDASSDDPWCKIGRKASSYTSYCTKDSDMVKFGASANIKTSDDAMPTPDPAPAPEPAPAPAPAITSSAPAPTQTPTEESPVTPVKTPESTSSPKVYVFPSSSTLSANPSGSWSPRSLDSNTAYRYAWMVLFAALFY